MKHENYIFGHLISTSAEEQLSQNYHTCVGHNLLQPDGLKAHIYPVTVNPALSDFPGKAGMINGVC